MSSNIGSSKSSKFQIGAAEIRIGPLNRAGKLTQADSVGLLQSASVNFTNETVDLEGGLPKTLIDTVIVKQTAAVQASAYEFTTNNIRVMLNAGDGVSTAPAFSFITNNSVLVGATKYVHSLAAADKHTGVLTSTSGNLAASQTDLALGATDTLSVYDQYGTLVWELKAGDAFNTIVDNVKTQYTAAEIIYTTNASSYITGISLKLNLLVATAITFPTLIPVNSRIVSLGQIANSNDLYDGLVKTTDTPALGTSLTTSIPDSMMKDGHLLVVYPVGRPQDMSIVKIKGATSGGVITIDPSTPLLFAAPIGSVVYRADSVALGKTTTTQYFAMDVISMDHSSGKPMGFRFWKAAVSSGLDFSFSSDAYGTTPLAFKIMKPSTEDMTTGDLTLVKGLIEENPYGMYFGG